MTHRFFGKIRAVRTIKHLRGIPRLRPLRGRRPVVVACLDDPAAYEERRDELAALGAELLVEREPGELSARLGRPSVTVCDRFLEVELHAADVTPREAVSTVRWLEMRCEECPQSGVDMAPRAAGGDSS
ncbi:MAG: hypothetical protein QOJ85_2587 [Solirubrobacteraceae bacterium]|nr:hypothetical protein [Solirubrobacteraceae bacterium]